MYMRILGEQITTEGGAVSHETKTSGLSPIVLGKYSVDLCGKTGTLEKTYVFFHLESK